MVTAELWNYTSKIAEQNKKHLPTAVTVAQPQ